MENTLFKVGPWERRAHPHTYPIYHFWSVYPEKSHWGVEGRKAYLHLIRGNFHTHDPTWAEIQSFLNALLTGEEKVITFWKAQGETERIETMTAIPFTDQRIKQSQITNPTGTTKTMDRR